MPKLDAKSGGVAGFILLMVVVILAMRACRSTPSGEKPDSGVGAGAA